MTRLCRNSAVAVVLAALMAVAFMPATAQDLDPKVKEAETKRIAVVEKVKPSVVAIFGPGGQGGGSGVLIDDQGYALTNFHVTSGAAPQGTMQCGLADGVLYDAVLVGLDKVGDVALIKLLPKKEGDKFPFAAMGDSDKVKAGEWSLAMGNPFLLATDFTPTVTFGLISGVNRYQYPSGTLLEYTDCIQIETSINPGNSGGPLFNMDGELIGINGRGSFDKRGRVNSGVGYAISINQIKNFMGHLRVGLDSDHASLGAIIESEADDGATPRMMVRAMLENSDVYRRKMESGDELFSFAGRRMSTVNQYKNVLGIYPRGWRVPMIYRRNDAKKEILVRLMGVQKQELPDEKQPPNPAPPPPPPQPGPRPVVPAKPSPAAKFYEAKPGFANNYFNKQERKRLLESFAKQYGDFTAAKGEWEINAAGDVDTRPTELKVRVKDEGGKAPSSITILGLESSFDPYDVKTTKSDLIMPPKSGGMLMALYLYRQLLTQGEAGFKGGEFYHGGYEPFYLSPPKVSGKVDLQSQKVMCEVLRTRHLSVDAKWYFSLKDQKLLGFEVSADRDEDPCEVYLMDYKPVAGRQLPTKMHVRHGGETFADSLYGEFSNVTWKLGDK